MFDHSFCLYLTLLESHSEFLRAYKLNLRLSLSWSLKCSVIFQIFTNADEVHAEIVLKKLGLEDCFEGIICFETINRHPEFAKDQHSDSDVAGSQPLIVCKPSQEAMRRAILLAEVDPAKTVNIISLLLSAFGHGLLCNPR